MEKSYTHSNVKTRHTRLLDKRNHYWERENIFRHIKVFAFSFLYITFAGLNFLVSCVRGFHSTTASFRFCTNYVSFPLHKGIIFYYKSYSVLSRKFCERYKSVKRSVLAMFHFSNGILKIKGKRRIHHSYQADNDTDIKAGN